MIQLVKMTLTYKTSVLKSGLLHHYIYDTTSEDGPYL